MTPSSVAFIASKFLRHILGNMHTKRVNKMTILFKCLQSLSGCGFIAELSLAKLFGRY
jgi:hypothetical protein